MKKFIFKPTFRGIFYGLFLGTFVLLIFFVDSPSRYVLTESYIFHSPQQANVAVGILIPKTKPFQFITGLTVEGGELLSIDDTGVVAVALIRAAVSSTPLTLSYHVYLPKGAISWDAPFEAADLQPGSFIESGAPDIIRRSNELTQEQHNADVRKIFDFVSGWLKWPSGNRVNDSSSALSVLKSRSGVCIDFAHLMTALLRADRIPSHTIVGLAMPSIINFRNASDWNHQAESHAWVEYLAGGKWHFADPAWGGSSCFDHFDGRHLSFGSETAEKIVYTNTAEKVESLLKDGSGADTNITVIGAMTAPLRFIAVASSNKVRVTPKGEVGINYGYHLPFLVLSFLIFLLTEIVIRRKTLKI